MPTLSNKIRSQLTEKVNDFIIQDGENKGEVHIQTYFIGKVLEILGWTSKNCEINPPNNKATGTVPDILLKNSKQETIFIIECKAGRKKEQLDKTDKNGQKTFVNQLLNYCKDKGINWGILTNFSEWRIYNTVTGKLYFNKRYELIKNGKPNEADIKELFEFLLFETLMGNNGKIDSDPIYYKSIEDIKEDFFQKLKIWRINLKSYLHKHYSEKHSTLELDNQTQRILDRLIFISYCHKKKIISSDILSSVLQATRKTFYDQLKVVFEDCNEKYNSDIFSDAICDSLKIDNEVIEPIITGINSIDFSQINVHIIGEVYENYLGELLKSAKSVTASSETKEREKRKSHGIFYTPDFIVDYIVDSTIGIALKHCKTLKDIEALKIIDHACGSGSFLIKAFDVLFDKYVEFSKNKGQLSAFAPLEISKKILTHNLFGVDLDERAVEIAKLNLLLKALEKIGDTQKTGRKILPNLSLNICIGNSLVSGKIDENSTPDLFSSKSEYKNDLNRLIEIKEKFYREDDNDKMYQLLKEVEIRSESLNNEFNDYLLANYFRKIGDIKPLHYEVKFCEIFKQGGFDCVIGNPPYVQLSMETNFSTNYKDYLIKEYGSSMGRLNTFGFFIKKSINIAKEKGTIGLIIPNTLTTQDYYQGLRKSILDTCDIKSIVNYDKLPFKDAVVENITIVLQKGKSVGNKIDIIDYTGKEQTKNHSINQSIYNSSYGNQFIKIASQAESSLKSKILKTNHFLLGNKANINQAIALKQERAKYIFNSKKSENYKPVLDGRYIDRYEIKWDGSYLKYDINAIHSCKRTDIFTTREKFFFRRVNNSLAAAFDNNQFFALNTLVVVTLKEKSNDLSIKYLLAIFNSKLLNYYYTKYLKSTKKVYSEIQARQVEQLPIAKINIKDASDKKRYEKIIRLVDDIIKLKKAKKNDEKSIDAIDNQINSEVYKLYDLSEKEIAIIEESKE